MLYIKNKPTIRNRAGQETLESLEDLGYHFNENGKLTTPGEEAAKRRIVEQLIQKYDPYYDENNQADYTRKYVAEAQTNDKLYNYLGKAADYMNDFRHTAAGILTANPYTFIPGAMWSAANLTYDNMHGDTKGMERTITEPLTWYAFGKLGKLVPKSISRGVSKFFGNPISNAVNERVVPTNEVNSSLNTALGFGAANPIIEGFIRGDFKYD